MEKYKEPNYENKEKELFNADIRVDFRRHGRPMYTEDELETAEYEGELLVKELEKIKSDALITANEIVKGKECVVIISSLKKRAFQTAEVYRDVFEKEDIPVYAEIVIKSSLIKDAKLTPGFYENMSEKIEKGELSDYGDWMKYWAENEILPEGVDKPKEVKNRFERLIGYLENMDKIIEPPEGVKIHFICVGHEETVRDLLEKAFDEGTEKGTGPSYGEGVRIDIFKNKSNENPAMKLTYRNKTSKLVFNKKDKHFISKAEI